MELRGLGHRVQELEAGPYRFLLSDSIPVAYQDEKDAYRSQEFLSKAVTRHINAWLTGIRAKRVPQAEIQALMKGVDRFQPERRQVERRQGEHWWLRLPRSGTGYQPEGAGPERLPQPPRGGSGVRAVTPAP